MGWIGGDGLKFSRFGIVDDGLCQAAGVQKEADESKLDMKTFEEACCGRIRDSEKLFEWRKD
jgi:hypothetical protein